MRKNKAKLQEKIHPVKYREAVISAKPKLFDRVKKMCKLCGIDFDIWAETMNFSQEREERMRKHALDQCRVCKCFPACSI